MWSSMCPSARHRCEHDTCMTLQGVQSHQMALQLCTLNQCNLKNLIPYVLGFLQQLLQTSHCVDLSKLSSILKLCHSWSGQFCVTAGVVPCPLLLHHVHTSEKNGKAFKWHVSVARQMNTSVNIVITTCLILGGLTKTMSHLNFWRDRLSLAFVMALCSSIKWAFSWYSSLSSWVVLLDNAMVLKFWKKISSEQNGCCMSGHMVRTSTNQNHSQ